MAHVALEGRYGVALGESNDQAMAVFEESLAGSGAHIDWFGGRFASASTPADDPLVQQLSAAHAEVSGTAPAIIGGTYGSDLRQLVRAGIPTVQYGPGDAALAHGEDEEVAITRVRTCREVIQRWLQM
jgi:acetylornithine deacetylase